MYPIYNLIPYLIDTRAWLSFSHHFITYSSVLHLQPDGPPHLWTQLQLIFVDFSYALIITNLLIIDNKSL
jgi:hypothetical protein